MAVSLAVLTQYTIVMDARETNTAIIVVAVAATNRRDSRRSGRLGELTAFPQTLLLDERERWGGDRSIGEGRTEGKGRGNGYPRIKITSPTLASKMEY